MRGSRSSTACRTQAWPDDEFQRVSLPADSRRGGLLTQAAILSLTSDGTRHRPVHRGKWVSEAIFGKSPPPPPANVDPIEPNPVDAPKATLRMKLEAHIHDARCASCHSKIDPLGLAFENYDAIGRWRTEEVVEGTGENPPVNPAGKFPDGRTYKTPEEFKQLLLADLDTLQRRLHREARHLRPAPHACRSTIARSLAAIAEASRAKDYRLRDIVEAFVTFRSVSETMSARSTIRTSQSERKTSGPDTMSNSTSTAGE